MMMNSSKNQLDGYERGKTNVSSGNKNSQHANQDARNSAEQKYEDAKAKFKEINSKPQKTPEDIKLREKLSKQIKHWQQKKDFTGDNHSRNAKGNR